MNELELTGRSRSHVREIADPPCMLHVHVVSPFQAMRRAAAGEGFDLQPASGYRDFERQLAIWNGKFAGTRRLDDAAGAALDVGALTAAERVQAILDWSALPGASRHHWGTEVDLIDRRAVPAGHRIELSSAEFAPAGPFAPVSAWLEANAARFGFFRPYRGIRSGVRPEPWHWSFAPVSIGATRDLSAALLRRAVETAPLAAREVVLDRLAELHARYVASIDWP